MQQYCFHYLAEKVKQCERRWRAMSSDKLYTLRCWSAQLCVAGQRFVHAPFQP